MKCANCDEAAVYEVKEIVGISDPAKDHYGFKIAFGQCEEHMAELVRSTEKRYEVKALTKTGPRRRGTKEQLAWELDC